MREMRCTSCGASIRVDPGDGFATCEYCGNCITAGNDPSEEDPGPEGSPAVVNVNAPLLRRSCMLVVGLALILVVGAVVIAFRLVGLARDELDGLVERQGAGAAPSTVLHGFGGSGTGPGLFTDASQIGVDGSGNIYVAERETGRVQLFDSSGVYERQLNFEHPAALTSMAVSPEGTLYLAAGGHIIVSDGSGGPSDTLAHPEGWGFHDVTAGPSGTVVASWYRNRDDIIRFDGNSAVDLLLSGAISGCTGDPELNTIVAVDGLGNIFAYGSFNGSVFKFGHDGVFVTRFGSAGSRPGQFVSPSAIAADDQGNLWVSDFGRLLVFDGDGLYLGSFQPGHSIDDMVIGNGNRLYGVTSSDSVVVIDLRSWLESL